MCLHVCVCVVVGTQWQFVSFREFMGGHFGDDLNVSQVLLAKEVLAEIPDQVMSYMKKYNVKPNPPMAAKTNQTVPRPR